MRKTGADYGYPSRWPPVWARCEARRTEPATGRIWECTRLWRHPGSADGKHRWKLVYNGKEKVA